MQNSKVEIYYGSTQSYEKEKRAGRIDENALYFIDGILYCGYDLYTNKYEIVDTLPAVGVKNIVYVVKSDKTVAIWDNVDNMWIFIYEPNGGGGGISETHTHDNKSVLDKITQTLLDAWNSAVSHISDTIKHITSTERKNWNDAYAHSTSAHAPSNAEVNQNAFSNVVVGSTTISADSKTDSLTLASGSNVNITADPDTDKITISSTDTKYTHPTYTAKTSGLYKMTVDATGHISATSPVTKEDIVNLGIPSSDTNTTYSAGTGISLQGTTFSNSGVRSVSTGGTNGTISVDTNGSSSEVAVKGLGSAAYTSSSDYVSAETGTSLQSQINTLNSNMSEFVGYINEDYLNTCNILKSLHGIYTEANGIQYVFSQLYCGAYTLQILYANDNTSINDKVAFRVIFTEDDTRETLKWTFLKTSSVV